MHPIKLELAEPVPATIMVGRGSLGSGGLGSLRWASLAVAVGLVAVLGSLVIGRTPAAPTGSPEESQAATEAAPTTPPGAIAWIDEPYVTPTPEPTEPPSALPLCDPTRLAMVAGGWGGATGSEASGVTIVNVAQVPCRLDPPVEAALRDATGALVASTPPIALWYRPGLDAIGLGAAGSAWATVVWSNWCGSNPPAGPLELDLTMPAADGGDRTLRTQVKVPEQGYSTPRCDAPGAGSGLGVLQFQPTGAGSGGTDLQPCAPADLVAWSGDWGAAAGTSYSEIAVLNTSGFDCLFPAGPTIELRDADGRVAIAFAPETPLLRPGATFVLPDGASAGSWLAFADWCSTPPSLPLRADVVLGGARLDVSPMPGELATIPVPPCMAEPGAAPPPSFNPAPFALPDAPEPPPSDPGDSLPFGVAIPTLPPASPGSTYIYTVTLTNASAYDKPINLSAACPSYVQRLFLPGEPGSIETRRLLNCEPAGVLTVGLSATFEMRLEIPEAAAAGTATLEWQLGELGQGVKLPLEILGAAARP